MIYSPKSVLKSLNMMKNTKLKVIDGCTSSPQLQRDLARGQKGAPILLPFKYTLPKKQKK